MSRRTPALVTVMLVVLSLVLAACGSDSSSDASAATTKKGDEPGGTTTVPDVPKDVPPGTTLRVGDQLDAMKLVLETGKQDQDFAYKVKYASFVGGPAMLQAFQAGAIDIGTVADTPLIFAQAAKQDVVAVAGWATEHGTLGLIASDKSGISSWKDVKGKKIAYQQGTVLQAVLLQGLDDVGLSLKDITPVNLPFTQISPALESGTVDAAILAPPLDTAYLDGHPDAKVVARADDITDRVNFIVAKKSVLEDPAKAAAIRDYIQRLVKARSYIDAHKDDWVQKFYVAQYNLTPEKGRELMDAAGSTTFVDLPGALVDAQQRLADLYHDAGEIPAKIDVAEEFDSRYNAAVAEAQAGQ